MHSFLPAGKKQTWQKPRASGLGQRARDAALTLQNPRGGGKRQGSREGPGTAAHATCEAGCAQAFVQPWGVGICSLAERVLRPETRWGIKFLVCPPLPLGLLHLHWDGLCSAVPGHWGLAAHGPHTSGPGALQEDGHGESKNVTDD